MASKEKQRKQISEEYFACIKQGVFSEEGILEPKTKIS